MTTRQRIQSVLTALTVAIAVAVVFGTTTGTAFADQGPGQKARKAKKSVATATGKAKPKVKVLTFGLGDELEGGVDRPDGDNVTARQQVVHSSLIRVRTQFVAEIFKSAEDL